MNLYLLATILKYPCQNPTFDYNLEVDCFEMRIAFGFDIFYPETNGVITATINLANNLIDMGHEVYFFVPKDKKFKDDVIEKGIHIIHIKNIHAIFIKTITIF